MKKIRLYLFILIPLIMVGGLKGQDLIFSQFYQAPLYVNPAFTGRTAGWQFSSLVRIQYPDIDFAYNSLMISADKHVKKLNSGFGVMALVDRSADGIYNRYNPRFTYSYLAKFTSEAQLRMGLDLGYQHVSLNTNRLLFPDQLSVNGGDDIRGTQDKRLLEELNTLDVSAGMLFYTPKYYVGASVQHLNQSAASFFETIGVGYDPLYQVHAGAEFHLGYSGWGKSYIAPAILYAKQSKLSQLNLGSYIRYASISMSAWLRLASTQQDALILALGLHRDKYSFGYSFDVNVSRLATRAGAHELSFRWRLKKEKIDLNDCFKLFGK